jgi:hypothetical protein
MATTSSDSRGIMGSMNRAARRHREHQAPTITGWEMTRMIWVSPRGMTRMPNRVTIQGMVRHRERPPMKPIWYAAK